MCTTQDKSFQYLLFFAFDVLVILYPLGGALHELLVWLNIFHSKSTSHYHRNFPKTVFSLVKKRMCSFSHLYCKQFQCGQRSRVKRISTETKIRDARAPDALFLFPRRFCSVHSILLTTLFTLSMPRYSVHLCFSGFLWDM